MSLGCLASFHDPGPLERAVLALRREGFRELEVFSPFALPGLQDEEPRLREGTGLGRRFPHLNVSGLLTLGGAVAGCLTAFGTQWVATVWASPYEAGGKPLFSWPAYVPITFVFSVLCAGSALFVGTWWILRLPEPYHPVFNASSFRLDEDLFHVFVPACASYPAADVRRRLESLGADEVTEVTA